jgi:hypothetical protein
MKCFITSLVQKKLDIRWYVSKSYECNVVTFRPSSCGGKIHTNWDPESHFPSLCNLVQSLQFHWWFISGSVRCLLWIDKVRAKDKTYIKWSIFLWIKKPRVKDTHIHWVEPFLLSYILRCVSFTEVGSVCRVASREPIHLCTCVTEEGGDGEAVCSETPSLSILLWCHTHSDTSVSQR